MPPNLNTPGQNRPGPSQNPGQPPQAPDIDPTELPDVSCTCGNETFQEATRFKKVSKVVSPTGESGIFPMKTFVCTSCGEEFTGLENESNIEQT